MKRFFAFITAALCLTAMLPAQTPFYILFNTGCMDQLEYKYTYQNTNSLVYSVRPSTNEQFILSAANEGITSPTLPKGAVNCRDISATPGFMDMVNNHTRNVYMVHQRSQGDYLLMPIIGATNVIRNGAFYLITAPTYAFALDTTKLVNETNLATGRSASMVYFTGMKFRDCRIEYAFRREPNKANMERSDFEFLPGLGFTSQRSGMNASEAEANHVRLVKVNGIALDDFIAMSCNGKSSQAGTTISPYTGPVNYNSASSTTTTQSGPPNNNLTSTVYREPSKEEASIQNAPQPVVYNTVTGLVNCPEPIGQGYHIVQPGENLRAIARTYGKKETDIIKWNGISNPNKIEICQKIWLQQPPKASTSTKGGDAPKPVQHSTGNDRKVINQGELAKGQITPAQYSTQPQYYTPVEATTKVTPVPAATPVQPTTHKVKTGDYLYKIAKQYGCVEECIRRANNMPLEGDIMLWPGQELLIPECTCTMPVNTTQKGAKTSGQTPVTPQQYSTPGTQPVTQPTGNTFIEQPQTDTKTPATNPIEQPKTEDTNSSYFTEHVIQVGETLNSIAYRYRVSGAELAQLNGINPNDQLIAGKRLLIPHKTN